MRSYDETHIFWNYRVRDEYDYSHGDLPYPMVNKGPVLTYFLDVDFFKYKESRLFTNLFGIEGFATFYPSLKETLSAMRTAEQNKTLTPLSKNYMEELWGAIKKRMRDEQEIMYTFAKRFTKAFPTFPRIE